MLELFSQNIFIVILFFIIATLYSSVGFGGGSSYLAVLALSGLLHEQIRSTALICNIIVVTGNVILFTKQKQYDWKKVIPLVIISVPMAFIGGYIKLTQHFFFILLGITLLFAAVSMWFSNKTIQNEQEKHASSYLRNSIIGGSIGFISGLVGIGGGIFLAPVLHLSQWSTPKKIAAVSSFFILINSISGLTGQLISSDFNLDWRTTSILMISVFLGSLLGNQLRNSLLSPTLLKKGTAILIAFVAIRILFKYFFLDS